ncbi:DUF4184 family protein [Blastococcus sp. SYSU D00695]
MPFTPSHVAAVLPLLRTGLPASALVAGSVAPDLPYFLPGRPDWPTHTAVAVVTLDVLLAVAAWALWHGVLAAPALATAPAGVRGRLHGRATPGLRRRLGSPRAVASVLLAAAAGAATHVLWDEFTHGGRFGTDHLAVLRDPVGGLPGHQWAQYASGVLGIAVLLLWVRRWWQRTPARPARPAPGTWWVYGGLLVAATLAGAGAVAAAGFPPASGFLGARVGGGTGAALALAGALGWHLRARRRTPVTLP